MDDLPDLTEAVTQTVKLETKETQTDVYLKVDGGAEGSDEETFLDLLYDNPPPTVYHQDWGVGIYHPTQKYEGSAKKGKQFCYTFKDGVLRYGSASLQKAQKGLHLTLIFYLLIYS